MLDKYFTAEEIDKLVELGPEKIAREIFHNKPGCRCKDCEELRKNAAKHLEHPFYSEANKYREQERIGQIVKGSEKYQEPFNPASWTAKQLLSHAMQENVDQGHYIYGLYEKIEEMERELVKYKNRCKDYEAKINAEHVPQSIREEQTRRLQAIIELRKFIETTFPGEGEWETAIDFAIKKLQDQKEEIEIYKEAVEQWKMAVGFLKKEVENLRLHRDESKTLKSGVFTNE
jgi:hypothetical protein